MIYITIVDDEPISADGLSSYLENEGDPDWQIRTCYSSKEVQNSLNNRIDILITDILMPDTDGIELARQVSKRWPLVKIIFLTASQILRSAQDAVRIPESVDYILKDDPISVVLKAVQGAIQKIEEEKNKQASHREIEMQMLEARPMLQTAYVTRLLRGQERNIEDLKNRMQRLHFPLEIDKPVLLLMARYGGMNNSEPEFSYLTLDNLIHTYTGELFRRFSMTLDPSQAVWLFQFHGDCDQESADYLFSMLDVVLESFEKTGRQVSLILDNHFSSWEQLYLRYKSLADHLEIMEDNALIRQVNHDAAANMWDFPSAEQLLVYLRNGQGEKVSHFIHSMGSDKLATAGERVDFYRVLLKVFSRYLAEFDMNDASEKDLVFPALQLSDKQWERTLTEAAGMMERLGNGRRPQQETISQQFQDDIANYVKNHLSEDLSLVTVADQLGMSPSYFSRKFKRAFGVGYAEYVMSQRIEYSKQLLLDSEMTMNSITEKIGYYSVSHFISSFKRFNSITPSEYRKRNVQKGKKRVIEGK